MPIKFRCPHCEQFLGISESKAGTITDCPTCGHSIRVPELNGTVGSLPSPTLNLQDEGLLSALGELATLTQGKVDVVPEPPRPVPGQPLLTPAPVQIVSAAPEPVEMAVQNEPVVHPVAHIEDPDETPASPQEVLTELIRQFDDGTPPVDPETPAHHRGVSPRFWSGMVLAALLCGVLLGLALRGSSQPSKAAGVPVPPSKEDPSQPQPVDNPAPIAAADAPLAAGMATVSGHVTYRDAAGNVRPDREARILLLPLTRTGTTKLTGLALRVGADAQDRQLLQAAAKAMGGAFATADPQGEFSLSVAAGSRYGLLVVSQHQSRPAKGPLIDSCRAFLANCFERPELAIGNVDYSFQEVSPEPGHPVNQEIAFQGN